MSETTVKVAAAVLVRRNLVLASSRPADRTHSGKWEFPGGKADKGESLPDALRREMLEELAIEVEVGEKFCTITPEKNLEITFFFCTADNTAVPEAREKQQWCWADAETLKKLDFLPADKPVAEKISAFLQNLSP